MRRTFAILLLASASLASAAPRTKVAVMDVKNVQGVPEGTATILTEIVVSEVARYGMEVVSKSDIAAIVGFEKQKSLLGCSDDSSCLAEIGGALGVDFMMTGQVGQIGSRYRISLLLVDVKKGKVAGRAADFCDKNEDALANAAVTRVREIIGVVQASAATAAERPASAPAQASAAKPSSAQASTSSSSAPPKAVPPPSAAAAPAPAPMAAPPPGEPAGEGGGFFSNWSRKKIAGVSLVGGGGLVLIGGAVMGMKAKSLESDLSKATNNIGYYYDYPAKRDKVKSTALIADVLYGVGIAAAGAGGFLWFTDKPAGIALVPVVGDGQAGLVAMGRF